ncbi:MAG: hypothetical protein JOZ15_08575, partial [Acidobacteria bacterium]|nr:hypothetical protein [Acidobacteriota bacterium]
MASSRSVCALGLAGIFGVLFGVSPAWGARPPGGAAGACLDPTAPKITKVTIVALTPSGEVAQCVEATTAGPRDQRGHRGRKGPAAEPKGCPQAVVAGGARAKFLLAIQGERLTTADALPEVELLTEDAGHPVLNGRVFRTEKGDKEIEVAGEATIPTTIKTVQLRVDGKPACSPAGLTVSFKPNPPAPKLKEFTFKLAHQKNKEFPNLHSALLTKASGDDGVGFDAKPSHMSVDLEPTGATDLAIVQSNEQRLELHFVAAADYVPKDAVITVYKGSDLDSREPSAVGKLAPAKPPADPNAPKIANVETVFIDRGHGDGRLKIYGKGFGTKLARPGYPVDDYVCECLERPKLAGYRNCSFPGDLQWPNRRTHAEEKDDKEVSKNYAKNEENALNERIDLRNEDAHEQAAYAAERRKKVGTVANPPASELDAAPATQASAEAPARQFSAGAPA